MTEPLTLISDLASFCSTADADTGAGDLLAMIEPSIPYAAAAIAVWDPVAEQHRTVSTIEYPQQVLDYLNTGFTTDDPAFLAMRYRGRPPLRWCDIPHYQDTYSAREVFIPGGFHEGVTTCLFAPDGRYTGALHISTDLALPVGDADVHLLRALSRIIGPFIDPLRSPPADVGQRAERIRAVALMTPDRHWHAVDGADTSSLPHELLSMLAVPVDRCLRLGRHHEFHAVVNDDDAVHVRVRPNQVGVLVSVREAEPPLRLTRRELQVLQLIVHGCSNAGIGGQLHLSRSTVATHVEHILEKVRCASRVSAAALAVADGICAPPARHPETTP